MTARGTGNRFKRRSSPQNERRAQGRRHDLLPRFIDRRFIVQRHGDALVAFVTRRHLRAQIVEALTPPDKAAAAIDVEYRLLASDMAQYVLGVLLVVADHEAAA